MTTSAQTLKIKIDEYPEREDLLEFLQTSTAKEDITEFLTKEFDTIISFQIGSEDLLGGYPEAFILPLHSFVRNLSAGLKELSQQQQVDIPIYLQQHAVNEGDPSHTLQLKLEGEALHISMLWGGQKAAPAHIKNGSWNIDPSQARQAFIDLINRYCKKVTMLLGSLNDWSGEDISALFESF